MPLSETPLIENFSLLTSDRESISKKKTVPLCMETFKWARHRGVLTVLKTIGPPFVNSPWVEFTRFIFDRLKNVFAKASWKFEIHDEVQVFVYLLWNRIFRFKRCCLNNCFSRTQKSSLRTEKCTNEKRWLCKQCLNLRHWKLNVCNICRNRFYLNCEQREDSSHDWKVYKKT